MKNFTFNLQRFADIRNIYPNKKIVGTNDIDYIENVQGSYTVPSDTSDTGYKVIDTSPDNVHIYTGAGYDNIRNEGTNVNIYAGTGYKYIRGGSISKIYANGSIIDGSASTIYSNNSMIFGAADVVYATGNNFIRNGRDYLYASAKFELYAGAGNDRISGSYTKLNAGDGNNRLNINEAWSITSGTGNDYIDVASVNRLEIAGGNNTVKGNVNESLKTGAGDDNITLGIYTGGSSSVTVDAGEGKNKISLHSGSYYSVKTGSGDDSISAYASRSTIQTGLGNDTIINRNSYNSIVAGTEDLSNLGDNDKNYIWNVGSRSTLQGGNGSDTVWNKSGGGYSNIYTSFGKDSIRNEGFMVSINSGYGDDTIENYSRRVTIVAEGGNDSINNYNPLVTIDAGDGNDTIKNSAKSVSIATGDGNDLINLYAHTPIEDWANAVAHALSPLTNDIVSYVLGFDVFGTLDNVKILADTTKTFDEKKDALFDIISDYSERINDNLTKDATGEIAETFKDLIDHFNKLVTLGTIINHTAEAVNEFQTNKIFQILGEQILSDFEQDDNGRWCFAWNKNVDNPTTVNGGTGNDKIISDGVAFHIYEYKEGDGDDTIEGWNINDTVNITASGCNTLWSGDDLIIQTGTGSVTLKDAETQRRKFNRVLEIYCNGTFYGDISSGDIAGDETETQETDNGIYNTYSGYRTVSGTDEDNFIFNSGTGVTISGGAGDDKIVNIGEKVTYNYTSGNNTIYGFGAQDSLKITEESYETLQSGEDIIVRAGEGSITLKNIAALDVAEVYNGFVFTIHEDKEVAVSIDNTTNDTLITGTALNDTINNFADNVSIDGGAGKDRIYNEGSNVTITAGADDTITNYGEQVKIIHAAGDMTVNGFKESSSLKTSGIYATISDADNVSVKSELGTVILSNAATLNNINIDGTTGNGENIFTTAEDNVDLSGSAGNDTVISFGDNNTLDGGAGDDLIKLRGSNTTIIASAGNDTIENFDENDELIIAGNYSSVTTNGDLIINYGENSLTLKEAAGKEIKIGGNVAGDGNKFLIETENDLSISGTDNDDFIASGGSNVTIDGGLGNDTIINGGENVLFRHTGGNDTITGFTENSTLKVGGKYEKEASGNDIIIKTDKGTITLEDAADLSTVNIDGQRSDTMTQLEVVIKFMETLSNHNFTVFHK